MRQPARAFGATTDVIHYGSIVMRDLTKVDRPAERFQQING